MSYLDKTAGISGIYCITNLLDGKKYVGQSSDCGRRWRVHLNSDTLPVQQDIRKFGRENFQFQILEEVEDNKLRLEREKYWIAKLGTYENGYNSSRGGEPGWISLKGKKQTEEHRKHSSEVRKGKPHPHRGIAHSEETKHKISEANRKRSLDPEWKEKFKQKNRETHGEEWRKKLSEINKGKKLAEETKQKMHKKFMYKFPDGSFKELTRQVAGRYLAKGIQLTKVE